MKATTSIIATLTFIASATLLAGCGSGEASVTDEETIRAATPVPVEVAQPYRADIFAKYAATATIASDADAPVVARVSGEVVELLVEEGDLVVAGQVLARLDGEPKSGAIFGNLFIPVTLTGCPFRPGGRRSRCSFYR